MYIVGIDIAKKSHQAVIMNPDGTLTGRTFRFTNTQAGFDFLMKKISEVDSSLENFEFGMEATGHYWLNLYTWLTEKKAVVHVINPLQSDALRNLYLRKTKTDAVDSKIIAQVIRIGQYSETKLSDEKMLIMRDLCRQRFFLVDIVADLKRKIIVMMDRIFPEYQGFFSDTFGKSSLAVLKNCPSPSEIVSLGTERLACLLRTASNGKFSIKKAEALMEIARNSFAARISSQTFSLMIKQMIEQIELVERQIQELEQLIAEYFNSFNTKITQIPGIGPVLGASILSEIGDINRFSSSKKLAAYAGIDPSVKQSGQFVGTENHMSKRGSMYLRRSLWVAAFVSVHHCREIVRLYSIQTSRGKTHFQAMGFICHKLLNMVYAVLKNNVDYCPHICTEIRPPSWTNELAQAALEESDPEVPIC
ncbi:IS110 family transposase [Treponema sp.]|uniref:IS110 family transposase n=1 Tax=Treponema sp. TaxID=166 RepID=UPI003F09A7DF